MDPAGPSLSAFRARGWLNGHFYCWGQLCDWGLGAEGSWALGGSHAQALVIINRTTVGVTPFAKAFREDPPFHLCWWRPEERWWSGAELSQVQLVFSWAGLYSTTAPVNLDWFQ